MREYPYPCCRCGFCCIAQTCPEGQAAYGIGQKDLCPGLSFQGDLATCELARKNPQAIGVGAGCCIKARAIKDGIAYDFASLPPELKRHVVRYQVRR